MLISRVTFIPTKTKYVKIHKLARGFVIAMLSVNRIDRVIPY